MTAAKRRGGALRDSGKAEPVLSLTALHHLCRTSMRESMIWSRPRPILARCLAFVCAPAFGQSRGAPPQGAAAATDEGFPIESAVVKARCGSCHRSDDKGRMSRISYRRASAENWELTIKRMVSLNHVTLSPEDARNVLKYLTDHQGLAPEELRPIAFEGERRMVEFSYTADETTSTLCSSCHSIARVLGERRTKEEWQLLIVMHRSLYPLVDTQPMNGGGGFMRTGGRGGGGRGGARAGGRGADPARPGEQAADGAPPPRRPPGGRPRRARARASREDPAARHLRMVGLVGGDAAAEACGPLGGYRFAARQRRRLWRSDDRSGSGRSRHLHDASPLHAGAHRPNRDAHRARN